MNVILRERARRDGVVVLSATLPASDRAIEVGYRTVTGAVARADGEIAGAFDREHHAIVLPPSPRERELTLEVEAHALPTNLLPSGPGAWWWWINKRSWAKPRTVVRLSTRSRAREISGGKRSGPGFDELGVTRDAILWGHSHLDVAWLWTYEETKRKAVRTFANALALLDRYPQFVFVQSQPQLYEFVREADPAMFERIVERVREGRFDADVAALWVESDCNLPSGESLLRQMLEAHRFCTERFGIAPSIAWLPDTFGFARTLPSLLAHAGIRYFATTKLHWNDTTRFPYAQFVWRGPDGAEIVAASIANMDRSPRGTPLRRARERSEPMIVGYGDGGGGPTQAQVERAEAVGRWERPRAWFARLDAERATLPVHEDELYLEYHRGVYTTHHDVKARNAALERELVLAEELAAWCVAVRAPADALARLRDGLREAWRIVLRNQFHDVLPGTAIAPVYDDARAEYDRAHRLVGTAIATARAMLPRASGTMREPSACAPTFVDGAYIFENERLRARLEPSGAISELACGGGSSAVAQANLLALYRDRPTRWEAWNVDAGYQRSLRTARPQDAHATDGALEIQFLAGASPATMRVSLRENEAFLRVELAIDWNERRQLLRVENWLTVQAESVTYGAPHGVVRRSARRDTPERAARFEVPGQRFACVRDGDGDGIALMALDTYGWSARALERGGVRLGHSLLRGTSWPDPTADRGEQRMAWAYAPLRQASIGDVERLWQRFACRPSVALFESGDAGVLVVAAKPAEDGDGVVVRLRECDGVARTARVRCGGRMRAVEAVDALERPVAGEVRIEDEWIVAAIPAYGLRSFRVRF